VAAGDAPAERFDGGSFQVFEFAVFRIFAAAVPEFLADEFGEHLADEARLAGPGDAADADEHP
jgi:hypothetical protein